jgi:hypothetical protein
MHTYDALRTEIGETVTIDTANHEKEYMTAFRLVVRHKELVSTKAIQRQIERWLDGKVDGMSAYQNLFGLIDVDLFDE